MNIARKCPRTRVSIGFKKAEHVHVSYGGTFSNNLYADSFEAILEPEFGISLDLGRNLRTKNKQENSYEDAKNLAEGEIGRLELLQIMEERTIRDLIEAAPQPVPETWVLEIQLPGTHTFQVSPEIKGADLFLRVR